MRLIYNSVMNVKKNEINPSVLGPESNNNNTKMAGFTGDDKMSWEHWSNHVHNKTFFGFKLHDYDNSCLCTKRLSHSREDNDKNEP